MTNRRPTVLLMTNSYGAGGGAEHQLYTLAKGIDKEKFRVLVVTLNEDNFTTWEIPGVEFIKLNRRNKWDFFPLFRMVKILREYRVDIIQPFLTPSTLFGLLPAFLVGTPVKVVTERCGVRSTRRAGYRLLRFFEDVLGHAAHIAVANSVAGRLMLLERGYRAEKTCVIYNGLDLERLKADPAEVARIRQEAALKPGEPVIGISAWVIPAKDHFTFLRSASLVLKKKPSARFAILGDGPLVPELKSLSSGLGIAGQVIFFGARRDVGNYLHLFDVLVSSSVDHEGCSNSIIEAMALGKPVVATDVGGNRELVLHGENGFLVPPRDPPTMAGAILTLLDDPVLARRMGEKARQDVMRRFSMEQMVNSYQELWLRLLGKK